MFFSGKITNSIITFLHQRGEDLHDIYDLTDLPFEFLKDTSCWLDAARLDRFLGQVENWCVEQRSIENPLELIGHSAKELKAWGVLDSVLRMIDKPHDIFLQPQRFLSYFISPAPPIANIRRGEFSVSFDLPISSDEFPHVAAYIRSAIETIPVFMGLPMAEANWQQNRLSVNWQPSQAAFRNESVERRQMAPEVFENLISTLEKTEQALLAKTRELERIKLENALAAKSMPVQTESLTGASESNSGIHQQIMKLQDYFTRSQQLITLLIGQDRMSEQVREAMKRVNWERVQENFSEVTRELLNHSESSNRSKEAFHGQDHTSTRAADSRQSWLPNS